MCQRQDSLAVPTLQATLSRAHVAECIATQLPALGCFTHSSVLNAYNHFAGHRGRQGAAAGASARVLAAVAEHLDEGVRASVNDTTVAAEIRSAIDDPNNFDHLVHTVKLPIKVVRERGEQPQRGVATWRQHARTHTHKNHTSGITGAVQRVSCFSAELLCNGEALTTSQVQWAAGSMRGDRSSPAQFLGFLRGDLRQGIALVTDLPTHSHGVLILADVVADVQLIAIALCFHVAPDRVLVGR